MNGCTGTCSNGSPGCDVALDWADASLARTGTDRGVLTVSVGAYAVVPLHYDSFLLGSGSCGLTASVGNVTGTANLRFTLEPDGMHVFLLSLDVDSDDVDLEGCGVLSSLAEMYAPLVESNVVDAVVPVVLREIDEFVLVCRD